MRRIAGLVVGAVFTIVVVGCASGQDAVESGKRQFVVQGCYGCHTVEKFGTPIGPDLSRIGAKYPKDALVRWLTNPEAERPNAHMPKLELTQEQITALAAYLSSLR